MSSLLSASRINLGTAGLNQAEQYSGDVRGKHGRNKRTPNFIRRQTISILSTYSPELKRTSSTLSWLKTALSNLKLRSLVPLLFITLYMFIGSLLFMWFERAADTDLNIQQYKFYQRERELFLKRMDEIFLDNYSNREKWRKINFEEAIDYFHRRLDISYSNQTEWSLSTALYYSGTLFTTIGYGDVACRTAAGRLATVIYALIGIPLMLVTLNGLGEFLYGILTSIANFLAQQNSALLNLFHRTYVRYDQSGDLETGVNHTSNKKRRVQFQLNYDDVVPDGENMGENPSKEQRIPVMFAIVVTFGWLFSCAALFGIWENEWTYGESCYFMFISLSTIGLGDIAVKRRDLMVICFLFVIIGLSLVSMCIKVIQIALEDLYIKIIITILRDYQNKLAEEGNKTEAAVGMMQAWGNSRSAKYLLPLLSKNRRIFAMARIQDGAEANGIKIPRIVSNIDEKSGLPKIFSITKSENETPFEQIGALQNDMKDYGRTITTSVRKTSVQTENPSSCDKVVLASFETIDESISIQSLALQPNETVYGKKLCECFEKGIRATLDVEMPNEDFTESPDQEIEVTQTNRTPMLDQAVQTRSIDYVNSSNQTDVLTLIEETSQTETILPIDSIVQTDSWVLIEQNLQTDICISEDYNSQTESPTYQCQYVQTELSDDSMSSSEAASQIKLDDRNSHGKLERQLSEAMDTTKVSLDAESVEETERLDWNPIDGMHAERKRPVRALAAMFESRDSFHEVTRNKQKENGCWGRKTNRF